jgi:hypothetical protein
MAHIDNKLEIGISAWFTDTRIEVCRASECIHFIHDCQSCNLKFITLGHLGGCVSFERKG